MHIVICVAVRHSFGEIFVGRPFQIYGKIMWPALQKALFDCDINLPKAEFDRTPPPFIPSMKGEVHFTYVLTFPGGTLSLPILKQFSPPLLIQSSTWQNNSSKTLTLSTELNGCMGLLCWEVWVLLQVLEEIKVFLSTISQIRNHFSLLLFCLNLFAVTDFLCDVSRGLLLYLS